MTPRLLDNKLGDGQGSDFMAENFGHDLNMGQLDKSAKYVLKI